MESIFIVMPAYNESENISCTISQWYNVVEKLNSGGVRAFLVIANDGSRDDTYQVMCKEKEDRNLPFFEVLDKPNSGHGATLLFLYHYALSKGADYVFQTDSDGQTNPNEFWDMFDKRHDYDFQIGYRYARQDGSDRIVVTKVLKIVVWLMFHEWITDANTPFRLMQRDKLKAVMEVIPPDFFLSNVAISAIGKKWKYRMRFPKISFASRQKGKNSINMKRIFSIGWKALADFHKINVCLKYNKDK